MSGGLVALLDDIAALVKLTAASLDDIAGAAGRASAKAAGVVVDDTAVTPRYVEGLSPARELPIIRRIAVGSLRNKLLFILPAILLLSQFLPWLLTPLLMLGGTYLCFEGAEKIWEQVAHRRGAGASTEAADASGTAADASGTAADASGIGAPAAAGHAVSAAQAGTADAAAEAPTGPGTQDAAAEKERSVVSGAIRTDFILSAEIMVIALDEVASEPLLSRALILVVVAIAITLLVYGVVGLVVKMDDVGLHLAGRSSPGVQRVGRLLVVAMPRLLSALAVIGIVAMLWVGGHIILNGLHELGWHAAFDLVHHLEEGVADAVPVVGGVLGWVAGTAVSALFGLVVGMAVVAVVHWVGSLRKGSGAH